MDEVNGITDYFQKIKLFASKLPAQVSLLISILSGLWFRRNFATESSFATMQYVVY